MLQHKDIMQLQRILLMRRLIAYLLVLKYFKWLTSGKSIDLIKTEDITNGEPIDNFVAGTTTYTNNNLNQLVSTTVPDRTYLYDDDGNLAKSYTPDGYELNMTYDAENRMTSAQYTDNNSIVHRTEYYYSGDSLLVEMKKYDNGALTADSRYLRAGFLPIQERDANNAVMREYVWGLNMGGGIGGLLNLRQNSNDYAYLYDGKGNVASLINSSQSVVAKYTYDPFGVLMKKTATIDQPYQFSTKQYDEKLGMLQYEVRNLFPDTGKWSSRDPLGEEGDINLYRMVGNNPVNKIDPFGFTSRFDPGHGSSGGGSGNPQAWMQFWDWVGEEIGEWLQFWNKKKHNQKKCDESSGDGQSTGNDGGVPIGDGLTYTDPWVWLQQ